LSEEPEEAETILESLVQQFMGSEQQPQSSGDFGPDASILLLIGRGLCHRICEKRLFCPYPRCKAEIKNVSALLTGLNKKYELADVCYKDLMRHFIQDLYPERIDIILKTGDGVTVDRPWDVKRCFSLGCYYFHNKHHNVEIHSKAHKERYANIQEMEWF
jgi:hypothetical protein